MSRWFRALAAPTFGDEDLDRRAGVLHYMLLGAGGMSLLLVLVALSPIQPEARPDSLLAIYGPLLSMHGLCLWLIRRGRVHLAALLYNGMLFLMVLGIVFFFGGMSGQSASPLIVVVVLSAFTQDGRWALGYAVLTSLVGVGMVWAEQQGLIPPPVVEQGAVDNLLALISTAMVTALVAYLALRQLDLALARARARAEAASSLAEFGQALVGTRGHEATTELVHRTVRDFLGGEATLSPGEHGLERIARRSGPTLALSVERDQELSPIERQWLATVAQLLTTALEREDLDQQVTQAQRMQAFGQLAGGLAHDFNNLLAVIAGNTELLEETVAGADGDGRVLVAETLAATHRAASLTRKLLSFARPLPEGEATSRVDRLLSEVAALLQRALGPEVEVQLEVEGEVGWVRMAAGELHQILVNLGLNARDAMPQGGLLTISASRAAGKSGADGVHIDVCDTGRGMSQEVSARAFEPFFTTKAEGKGTGLGLSTVWGLVQSRGGTVSVQSEPGRGTKLSLWLPCAEASDDSQRMEPRSEGGRRVLVVDDDEAVLRTVARMLARKGWEVSTASTGGEALELLRGQSVDVLLTDVRMPGMSGPELVVGARAQGFDGATLYMSGFVDDMELGQRVLAKPFDGNALAAFVEDAVSAR